MLKLLQYKIRPFTRTKARSPFTKARASEVITKGTIELLCLQ